MSRRPRPSGGGHPPPLAPTVSSFKPRAQWNSSGSSVFLHVNLPGFYIDQIKINKDERTRSIQIQGERRLSAHTKARFKEAYRVPESCDMSKLSTSFSHGLLSIEFPKVVEGEKRESVVRDQGKTVNSPNKEENGGSGLNGSSVGRKKPLDEEKKVGTSQEKDSSPSSMAKEQEPKTYKSVLEGKKTVPPTGSSQEKMKEREASPSLGPKERMKGEKMTERKEDVQTGQQKILQKKLEEEKARSTPTISGSLNPKVRAKEDKVIERTDTGQEKTGQKVKETIRTPTIDGRLDPKVNAKPEKVVERKGDGKIGQKLKEEVKIGSGQKKTEEYTKPVVENEARRTEKEIAARNRVEPELKPKERVERIVPDVKGKSKNDKKDVKMVSEKVSGGETQERVKKKKVEDSSLVKETGEVKDSPEVVEQEKVDSDDHMKEGLTREGEDREKMVGNSVESETNEEESKNYDTSLVNVGIAALVIMGFGAYVFVPLVKLFIN